MSALDLSKLAADYAELERNASAQLDGDHIAGSMRTLKRVAECRYAGQGYELRVDAPDGAIDERWVAELIEALKPVLAKFKLPRQVFMVDELPRNAMGKVQKNRLREIHG